MEEQDGEEHRRGAADALGVHKRQQGTDGQERRSREGVQDSRSDGDLQDHTR